MSTATDRALSIEEIRAALPAARDRAYLNAGTFGPMPRAAYAELRRVADAEFEQGRVQMGDFLDLFATIDELRGLFGRLYHCAAADIAITHGTTDGVNAALWGMTWEPGDEIVTTRAEHVGGLASAYLLAQRQGVRLRFAAPEVTDLAEIVPAIAAEVGPRTRAVVVSHVSWMTGAVFPLREIARVAHDAGALLIVDGAQSVGVVPVDVLGDQVDVYSGPGQKWVGATGGTGGLYVSAEARTRIAPTYGTFSAFAHVDEFGGYDVHDEARRYDAISPYAPAVYALRAALRWLLDDVGLERTVFPRSRELADLVRTALTTVEGVTVTTPVGTASGLTHFTFTGWEPMAVVEELADRGVHIRSIGSPPGLRVSTGYYNVPADIERLVSGLREIAGLTPHPPRLQFPH